MYLWDKAVRTYDVPNVAGSDTTAGIEYLKEGSRAAVDRTALSTFNVL